MYLYYILFFGSSSVINRSGPAAQSACVPRKSRALLYRLFYFILCPSLSFLWLDGPRVVLETFVGHVSKPIDHHYDAGLAPSPSCSTFNQAIPAQQLAILYIYTDLIFPCPDILFFLSFF